MPALNPDFVSLVRFAVEADRLATSRNPQSMVIGKLALDYISNELAGDSFAQSIVAETAQRRSEALTREKEAAKEWGPKLWDGLHRLCKALDENHEVTAAHIDQAVKMFIGKIPCGRCKKHFEELVAANPPRPGDMFAWAVERHDEVNEATDKPKFGIAAARARYAS